MLYCSWDMACDRCNCSFSFWAIFCPFTTITARKMKISQNWKKFVEISSFYTSVPKIMIICYTVPEIGHMTDKNFFFFLGYFLPFYPLPHPPNSPKKSKFQKNEKTIWKYHHFTHVYQKLWLDGVWFLRCGVWQTGGQTDRWKRWHIEVCAPPKKHFSNEKNLIQTIKTTRPKP